MSHVLSIQRRRLAIATGSLTLFMSFLLASPSGASDSVLQQRLQSACSRVTQLEARVDATTARLTAGPSTPGSIAALQQRADSAQAAGRTKVVKLINQRIATLNQRLAVLPNQKAKLVQIQTKCQQLGINA